MNCPCGQNLQQTRTVDDDDKIVHVYVKCKKCQKSSEGKTLERAMKNYERKYKNETNII